MNKKFFAVLCASAMLLSICTACGDKTDADSSAAESSAAETTVPEESSEAEETAEAVNVDDIDFEDIVTADSGDAILAIVDGQWYVQYWGKEDDILAYDAKKVHIDGDGDYTVGVDVSTKGAQYAISGDPENGYEVGGLTFACIKVMDGTKLYPDMSIEIKEIRVDGKPVTLTAKNYTSSDDGVEMRANIINPYVNEIPEDAHTAEGTVDPEDTDYSAAIVDTADFAKWTTVEVDFTVTGTGGAAEGGEDAEGDTAEASEEEAGAEEDTAAEEDTEEAAAEE